jgi:uncharacterized repeat protein (TIGR03803 family)
LLSGSDNWLYGVTLSGGTASLGTIFKLRDDGTGYGVLHHFGSTALDGTVPNGGLAIGIDGAFYGTTVSGGTSNVGTVFRMGKDGSAYAVLHSFGTVAGEAQTPQAGLLAGTDGAFYGTTYSGGSSNKGTVFALNRDGSHYRVLHSFAGKGGQSPAGALMESMDGLLYGTTIAGGTTNYGTIFLISKDGRTFSTLVSCGCALADGRSPTTGLVEAPDGCLFGGAQSGGGFGAGLVFRLIPPHPPSIRQVAIASGIAQVQFWGLDGRQFQILRSTDLVTWSALDTIIMPASRLYTFGDSAPPQDTAFYSISQLPPP